MLIDRYVKRSIIVWTLKACWFNYKRVPASIPEFPSTYQQSCYMSRVLLLIDSCVTCHVSP